jgi:hypothetical protein
MYVCVHIRTYTLTNIYKQYQNRFNSETCQWKDYINYGGHAVCKMTKVVLCVLWSPSYFHLQLKAVLCPALSMIYRT